MSEKLAQAVHDAALRYPRTDRYLTSLYQNNICAAVFSSSIGELAFRALGLEPPRPADDLDLQVLSRDFYRAGALLVNPILTEGKRVQVQAGDGAVLETVVDEIVGHTGDHEVQLIRPLTPMTGGGRTYDTRFTGWATRKSMVFKTPQGYQQWAHPWESVAFWSLLQRGSEGNKFDAANAQAVLALCAPDDLYIRRRGRQLGLTQREHAFIERQLSASVHLGSGLPISTAESVPVLSLETFTTAIGELLQPTLATA